MKKINLLIFTIFFMIILSSFVSAQALSGTRYDYSVTTDGGTSGASNSNRLASTFTIGIGTSTRNMNPTGISLYITNSSVLDGFEVAIWNADQTSPYYPVNSSTAELISNKTARMFPDSAGWVNITLPSNITLTNATKYSFILSVVTSGTMSTTAGANVGRKTYYTASAYPSTAFIALANDKSFAFELWGTMAPIYVVLNNPSNNANIKTLSFNASITPSDKNLTNATLYIWNSSGYNINRTTSIIKGVDENQSLITTSGLSSGIYTWNVLGCESDGVTSSCNFASNNYTFNYGMEIEKEYFKNTTTEGNIDTFQLNFTIASGETISSARLWHNHTYYQGTIIQIASGNYSVKTNFAQSPVTLNANVSFVWNILFASGSTINSTNNTQQVLNIAIDDCSAQTTLILNYTLKNEETQKMFNVSSLLNSSIEIDVDISPLGSTTPIIEYSQNYTNNGTARVCIGEGILNNSNFRLDVQTRYYGDAYAREFNHIQNYTLNNNTISSLRNINLFDLPLGSSTEFLMTAKDANFLPIKGALIDITRKYVSEGIFKSVEIPRTDNSGQAVGHFDTDGVVYTINVYKDGNLISTFDNIAVVCEDSVVGKCKLNLNPESSTVKLPDYINYKNLNYQFSLNKVTRIITLIFSNVAGANSVVGLNVTKFDRFGNETICASVLTSSSGTMTCTVPETYGNLTAIAELWSDGRMVEMRSFSLQADVSGAFDGNIALFGVILIITITLMFVSTSIGIVIGAILGFIMAAMMFMYNGGSIIGSVSAIIWLIVAGGIIIYKISRRGN